MLFIKGQVIEGAVYSCYTLWQIANGAVIDRIQEHTLQKLDRHMVRNIMAINTPEADYFLINHFKRGDFINFVPEIQLLIKRGKGYFAKNAIEKMPDELLVRSDLQAFFAEAFSNLGYFAQMVLLEKLQNRTISNQLANVLIRNVTVDLYQNELIFKWLTCNFDKLNDPNTIKIIQNLKRSINKTN